LGTDSAAPALVRAVFRGGVATGSSEDSLLSDELLELGTGNAFLAPFFPMVLSQTLEGWEEFSGNAWVT